MIKSIVLIGFQSCGKTTVGKLLAEQLNWPFTDTDRLIEQQHPALTCYTLFKTKGSHYFRELEQRVILQLQPLVKHVIAVGGGSLLSDLNRLHLKQLGTCVYLETSQNILKKRLLERDELPAYLNVKNPNQSFDDHYRQREPIYIESADHIIETADLNPKQVAQAITCLID